MPWGELKAAAPGNRKKSQPPWQTPGRDYRGGGEPGSWPESHFPPATRKLGFALLRFDTLNSSGSSDHLRGLFQGSLPRECRLIRHLPTCRTVCPPPLLISPANL